MEKMQAGAREKGEEGAAEMFCADCNPPSPSLPLLVLGLGE